MNGLRAGDLGPGLMAPEPALGGVVSQHSDPCIKFGVKSPALESPARWGFETMQ